jgi:hypothetical protein
VVLNELMQPVFQGTSEEVSKWLEGNPRAARYYVRPGETYWIKTVAEYLKS